MKRQERSFNIYFALVCVLLLGAGCAMFKHKKKEQTTIRLYLEGQKADKTTAGTVLVTKEKFPYTVERDAFLNEADLSGASIVDNPDGTYYIRLDFNDHATLLLDMYTSSNKGKHIIVFAQFPVPGKKAKKPKKEPDDSDLVDKTNVEPAPGTHRESAWLAAVLIRNRISNGVFAFTPDASREEGLRIVRGLRNVIPKKKDSDKF